MAHWVGSDRLAVDAMAVTYRDTIGPYAQGDAVVSFIDLIKNATVPIVLYRPASAATDLGLYGSSQVGILGGLIRDDQRGRHSAAGLVEDGLFSRPRVSDISLLQPPRRGQTVEIDVGPEPKDIYDAAANQFVSEERSRPDEFLDSARHARVVVVAPPD